MKKPLYGLKQFPRMWYHKFDTYIFGFGFSRRKVDQCVYSKLVGDHFIYVILYVDDWKKQGNNQGCQNLIFF